MESEALQLDTLTVARQQRLDHLIRSTARLARRSGKRRALAVADFIGAHAQLAMPVVGAGLQRAPLKGPMNFYIAPITSADSILPSKDEDVRMFSQPSHSGSYGAVHLPQTRTIYLPLDWPISPIWTQLALLHEGMHAIDTVTGRRRSMTTWELEVKARRLEDSVLLGLYDGHRLAALLAELQPVVESAVEVRTLARFDLLARFDPDISRIFGHPISRYDLDEQRESMRRLAVAHYLRHVRAGPDLWKLSVPDNGDLRMRPRVL